MSAQNDINACRKCGTPNPEANDYCPHCGAVLKVSTALVNAQPRRVLPILYRFQFRWLFISWFVMLGCSLFAAVTLGIAGVVLFKQSESFSLSGMGPSLVATALIVTCVTFGVGGAVISRVSRAPRIIETIGATLMAGAMFGYAGRHITTDFVMLALVLSIPGTGAAGVGAWLGAPRSGRSQ